MRSEEESINRLVSVWGPHAMGRGDSGGKRFLVVVHTWRAFAMMDLKVPAIKSFL